MEKKAYEAPSITELGSVADLTQSKPGYFFDNGARQGTTVKPPPIPGVTVS